MEEFVFYAEMEHTHTHTEHNNADVAFCMYENKL